MALSLNPSRDVSDRPRRLKGFSYVGAYRYFLTICTDGKRGCFKEDDAATWMTEQITQFFEPRQFVVIAFCVMPDHVHLLLEGRTQDADLKSVMHDWKMITGFAWKKRSGYRLWQEGYYDHVIREGDSIVGIVRYILNNPFRAGLVAEGMSYRFAGSSRFRDEELADALIDWCPP